VKTRAPSAEKNAEKPRPHRSKSGISNRRRIGAPTVMRLSPKECG
jgi:hypothetical protein